MKFGSVSAWKSLEMIETCLFFWMRGFECVIPAEGETTVKENRMAKFSWEFLREIAAHIYHLCFSPVVCLFSSLRFLPSVQLFLHQYFSSSLAFLVCGYSKKFIGIPMTKQSRLSNMHSEGRGVEKLMGKFKNLSLLDIVNINAL